MLKTGADFGGELSGHFFHAENWYKTDDGILTAVRLISLLEKNNLDLTVLPNWGHIFTSEEIAVPCTKERKKASIKVLSPISRKNTKTARNAFALTEYAAFLKIHGFWSGHPRQANN